MKRGILFLAAIAASAALAPRAVRADELKLKDGTKITGTIVGFEDNSFKVKTSFGFALVQREQVASITISETAKKLEADKKPEPAAEKTPPPAPVKSAETKSATASTPASTPAPSKASADATTKPAAAAANTSSEPAAPVATKAPAPTAPGASPSAAEAPASKAAPTPAPAPAAAPPAATANAKNAPAPAPVSAPAAAPAKPAEPPPILEQVNGNSYVNETYGFRMYKPPAWRVIEGARSIMPGAITAMGTSDQTTYLLIGQQAPGKSLASDIEAAERRLREIMDNFRPLSEKRITVSGVSAIEHTFRGSVDQHVWSGIVVFVPFGTHLYTVFGMTSADSDLVQIQENVIARTITSLQFTR